MIKTPSKLLQTRRNIVNIIKLLYAARLQQFFCKLARDKTITAVNWFPNHFADAPEYTSTHEQMAIIERGESGIVLINAGTESVYVDFPINIAADGEYVCDITLTIFTVANGRVTGAETFRAKISGESVLVLRMCKNTY